MSHSLYSVVRRLASMLDRRRRGQFALLAAFSGANAVLEAVAALFVLALVSSFGDDPAAQDDPIGSAIRRMLGDGASPDRVTTVIALATLGFYVLKNTSSLVETYVQQRLVHQTAADASTAVVSAYLRVPMSFHYLQRSGDFLRNAYTATEGVYRTSMLSAVQLVSEGLAAIGLLVVLVAAAPLVTPIVVVMLLATVVLLYRLLRPRMTMWGGDLQRLASGSMQTIQESFGALRDARILGRDDYFVDRYRSYRNDLARAFWRSGAASNSPRFALETAFIITMVGTVLLLRARGEEGPDTVALLGLYAYAGLRLMPSANRVLAALGNLRLGERGVDQVLEALQVPAETPPRGDREIAFRDEIVVDSVSFQFAGTAAPALQDVSLRIGKGESIGIVGPSGGGKSTLVDVLVGLLEPDTGRVLVDGVDIRENLGAWRHHIGYVSQAVFLLDDTLAANVAFGVRPDDVDEARLWRALERAQLDAFVRALPDGLDTSLGERGVRLSGGQRQRVAVARALYDEPAVLIFDEATAALDTKTEDDLTAAIEALSSDRTVVIVAHRLSTVRQCDRLVVMAGGRVSGFGTFDELAAGDDVFRSLIASGTTR